MNDGKLFACSERKNGWKDNENDDNQGRRPYYIDMPNIFLPDAIKIKAKIIIHTHTHSHTQFEILQHIYALIGFWNVEFFYSMFYYMDNNLLC